MIDGNTVINNQRIKRHSTIFLIAVIAINVVYFVWRWATQETYEGCLKDAAKAANGVPLAYYDLKSICDDRETERLIARAPKQKASESIDAPLKPVTDQKIIEQLNQKLQNRLSEFLPEKQISVDDIIQNNKVEK